MKYDAEPKKDNHDSSTQYPTRNETKKMLAFQRTHKFQSYLSVCLSIWVLIRGFELNAPLTNRIETED